MGKIETDETNWLLDISGKKREKAVTGKLRWIHL